MINGIILELISGLWTIFIFWGINKFIRKHDTECLLPSMSNFYYAISFYMGFLCGRFERFSIITMILMDISIAYILYMMFTDITTYQLYSSLNIAGFVIGMIYLAMQGDIVAYGKGIWLYFLIVIISCITHTISVGDMELMISLSPYLYLYSVDMSYSIMFAFLLFYALTLLVTIAINIKKYIKTKQNNIPFAVSIAISYMLLIISFGIN